MKVVAVIGYRKDENTAKFRQLREGIISSGHSFEIAGEDAGIPDSGADVILSVGGDGTFLRCARIAASGGIPVLGVNFGRLGFLSENSVEAAVEAFRNGNFRCKEQRMLCARTPHGELIALNEITARRTGPAMLGISVSIDGCALPTYWGDGIVVASAAGSTAYNLSVGGPIVFPSSEVQIIAPIAPHNLNVRPLVIPSGKNVSLRFVSRDDIVCLSADNQSLSIDKESVIDISMAQFSLKRLCLEGSSFVKALCDKLSWGEDLRNEK